MSVVLRSQGVEKRGELVVLDGLVLAEDGDGHPVVRGSLTPLTEGSGTGIVAVCQEVAFHASGADLDIVGVGATLTEVSPRSRTWFDAVGFMRARLVAQVWTAATSGTLIVAQYSYDGGTSWRYLDGASGPTLGIDQTGTVRGPWATLEPTARGDILLRWATYGGDGATTPVLGKLALEFDVATTITGDGDDPLSGDPSGLQPLAWHISDQQATSARWADLTEHGNDLTPVVGTTAAGGYLNGRSTLRFTNAIYQWPSTMFDGAVAAEIFIVLRPRALDLPIWQLGGDAAGTPSYGDPLIETFGSTAAHNAGSPIQSLS
jgi:hypothetical protein